VPGWVHVFVRCVASAGRPSPCLVDNSVPPKELAAPTHYVWCIHIAIPIQKRFGAFRNDCRVEVFVLAPSSFRFMVRSIVESSTTQRLVNFIHELREVCKALCNGRLGDRCRRKQRRREKLPKHHLSTPSIFRCMRPRLQGTLPVSVSSINPANI